MLYNKNNMIQKKTKKNLSPVPKRDESLKNKETANAPEFPKERRVVMENTAELVDSPIDKLQIPEYLNLDMDAYTEHMDAFLSEASRDEISRFENLIEVINALDFEGEIANDYFRKNKYAISALIGKVLNGYVEKAEQDLDVLQDKLTVYAEFDFLKSLLNGAKMSFVDYDNFDAGLAKLNLSPKQAEKKLSRILKNITLEKLPLNESVSYLLGVLYASNEFNERYATNAARKGLNYKYRVYKYKAKTDRFISKMERLRKKLAKTPDEYDANVIKNNIAVAEIEIQKSSMMLEMATAINEIADFLLENSDFDALYTKLLKLKTPDQVKDFCQKNWLELPTNFNLLVARQARLYRVRLEQDYYCTFAKDKKLARLRGNVVSGNVDNEKRDELLGVIGLKFSALDSVYRNSSDYIRSEIEYFTNFFEPNPETITHRDEVRLASLQAAMIEHIKTGEVLVSIVHDANLIGAKNIELNSDSNKFELSLGDKEDGKDSDDSLSFYISEIRHDRKEFKGSIGKFTLRAGHKLDPSLNKIKTSSILGDIAEKFLQKDMEVYGSKLENALTPVGKQFAEVDKTSKEMALVAKASDFKNEYVTIWKREARVADMLGLTMSSVMSKGADRLENLEHSIVSSRDTLGNLRTTLIAEKDKPFISPNGVDHTAFRSKMIEAAILRLNVLLSGVDSPISKSVLRDIRKTKDMYRKNVDDMDIAHLYGCIAMGVIIASAVVGGVGLLSLAGRGGVALFGGLTATGETVAGISAFAKVSAGYATFAKGSMMLLGLGIGTTLGEKVAMESIDLAGVLPEFDTSWAIDDLNYSVARNMAFSALAMGTAKGLMIGGELIAASKIKAIATLGRGASTTFKGLNTIASPHKWLQTERSLASNVLITSGREAGQEGLEGVIEAGTSKWGGFAFAVMSSLDGLDVNLDLKALGTSAKKLGLGIQGGKLFYDGNVNSLMARLDMEFGVRTENGVDTEVDLDGNVNVIINTKAGAGGFIIHKANDSMAPRLVVKRTPGLVETTDGSFRLKSANHYAGVVAHLESEGFILEFNEEGSFTAVNGDLSFDVNMTPELKEELLATVAKIEAAAAKMQNSFDEFMANPSKVRLMNLCAHISVVALILLQASDANAGILDDAGDWISNKWNEGTDAAGDVAKETAMDIAGFIFEWTLNLAAYVGAPLVSVTRGWSKVLSMPGYLLNTFHYFYNKPGAKQFLKVVKDIVSDGEGVTASDIETMRNDLEEILESTRFETGGADVEGARSLRSLLRNPTGAKVARSDATLRGLASDLNEFSYRIKDPNNPTTWLSSNSPQGLGRKLPVSRAQARSNAENVNEPRLTPEAEQFMKRIGAIKLVNYKKTKSALLPLLIPAIYWPAKFIFDRATETPKEEKKRLAKEAAEEKKEKAEKKKKDKEYKRRKRREEAKAALKSDVALYNTPVDAGVSKAIKTDAAVDSARKVPSYGVGSKFKNENGDTVVIQTILKDQNNLVLFTVSSGEKYIVRKHDPNHTAFLILN